MDSLSEVLKGVEIMVALPPWVIPAILAGIDLIGRARGGQDQVENANSLGRTQHETDIWQTQARLGPEVGRDQQLDPVRNALIADLGSEFFPGIDPSVFSNIRSAGPRPGIPEPPGFRGLSVPGFGSSLLGAGIDPRLAAGIFASAQEPGVLPENKDWTRQNPEAFTPKPPQVWR